jgi:type IV conjugative transfer system coupling protein TraD
MSKKKLGPGGYTRGFETFGHYMAMLKSSIKIHLFLSLACGLIFGSCWFHFSQEEKVRNNLSQYLKASVLSSFSEEKLVEYELGNGKKEYPSGIVYGHMNEKIFDGRTAGFLARQWAFKLVVSWLVFLIFSAVFMAIKGRKLSEDEHRRGAKLVDVDKEKRRRKWRRILAVALASLVLGTLGLYLSLGSQGRKHIGNYFWAATYTTFDTAAELACPDPECRLAWFYGLPEDGFRDTKKMYSWLRKNAFNGYSMAWISLCWLLGIGLTFGAGIIFLRIWKWDKDQEKNGLVLAEVEIPEGAECSHLLFSGSPGSGKSTAIKELLDQVRERGQKAIIYDPSGEYIGPYFREGKDFILNPLDDRSMLWTLWADVREKTDYRAIARSLFPVGGKDPFWNDAGAVLFAATAEKLAEKGNRSNSVFHRLLTTGTIEKLGNFLERTSAAKFLDKGAGAMPSNLIATVTSKLAAWELLEDPKNGSEAFSIRNFIEKDESDSWLFLAMRQDQQASLRPLVSLWCDLAANSVLSLPPSRDRRLWIVLDEVASLQRLPALHPLLSLGRKYGAAVVLGLQSIPQLRDSYGRDAAAALASQPQTWLALRTVEPDTARWLEHALGEAEVEEIREAVSMGAADLRDGVSMQQNLQKRAAAMATELMTLPDLEGFLKLPGDSPVQRVRLEVKKRDEPAKIYVPRKKKEKTA